MELTTIWVATTLTYFDINILSGPASAKTPTLLICVTTASMTSPLKGRKTMAR